MERLTCLIWAYEITTEPKQTSLNFSTRYRFCVLASYITNTALKVPVFGIILVCIFPHSDWIRRDTSYLVRMRENADQNNSEYGHFLRSEKWRSDTQILQLLLKFCRYSISPWNIYWNSKLFNLQNQLKLDFTEEAVQRCSLKKVFLQISQNSQENTCARVSF